MSCFVLMPIILICMMSFHLQQITAPSQQRLRFCLSRWLNSTQEALAAWGYCYSWTRCFHCLCIFLGIWITIPQWLRICWPNEPTWLIDTGDHQSSHSSSAVVNKIWIFHPPNVCLIMDRFNPIGEKKSHTASTCLTMPDHGPTSQIHERRLWRLPRISKIWNDDCFLGSSKSSFYYKIAGGNTNWSRKNVFSYKKMTSLRRRL